MTRAGTIAGLSLAMSTALSLSFVQAFAAPLTPDPKGIEVVKFLVADDARLGILSAGKALFTYDKQTGPYINTTPHQIEQDYSNNEVSADEKYKDKLIVFSGRINAIRKDLFGSPFVDVDTGQALQNLQAKISDDITIISKLSKGERIDFVCKGASYSIMSPVLNECYLRSDYTITQEQEAAADVAAWLNGGEAPAFLDTPKARTIVFYIYFAGTKMSRPQECSSKNGSVNGCAKQLKAAKPSNAEFAAAMDAAKDELGLMKVPLNTLPQH